MTAQNDELSSHRTRTNRRPEQDAVATAPTSVLDGPEEQVLEV